MEEYNEKQSFEDTNNDLKSEFHSSPKVKKHHDRGFKIITMLLLIVSLSMNGYLFYRISMTCPTVLDDNQTVVNPVDYKITTDISEMVSTASKSVVAIATYNNGKMAGSGSGVVYQANGTTAYIITNHHVIEDSSEIQVIFSDGKSNNATLLGSDNYSDIAVLKVTVDKEVTPIQLGNSDVLQAGEPAIAIGSPLGIEYAGSVTQGIISATNRVVAVDLNDDGQDDWDMNVIQTDAAINPGNSGGAFVNAAGELIGITSMKFSSTSVEGMGFALPINDVMKVVDEIRESGKVTRPVLGVSCVSLENFSQFELAYYRIQTNRTTGLYVSEVAKDGAAMKAGVQSGDIIISFGGEDVTTYKTYLAMLYDKKPGDSVEMIVDRGGEEVTLTVILGS